MLALVAEVPSTETELGLEAASAISPGVSEPSAFGTLKGLWRVNGLDLAYSFSIADLSIHLPFCIVFAAIIRYNERKGIGDK